MAAETTNRIICVESVDANTTALPRCNYMDSILLIRRNKDRYKEGFQNDFCALRCSNVAWVQLQISDEKYNQKTNATATILALITYGSEGNMVHAWRAPTTMGLLLLHAVARMGL